MNILLLDQFSDLGGAQLCLLDLLPAMQGRGWRPVVAAPGDGDLLRRAKAAGAIATRIACEPYSSGTKTPNDIVRFAIELPRLKRQIRHLMQQYQTELLFINGPRIVPAATWAVEPRMPVLFHCHSHVPKPYGAWLVGRSLTRAGATVISSSRFAAESIGIEATVIYNGVKDCARPRPSAAGGFRIGVIGRIAPQKGQAVFVQAARVLLDSIPNCRFEICGAALFGDREAADYDLRVRQLASGMPFDFTGWTDDVASILARLDVLVVPSTAAEATTRVILEAFSAGVPVAAFATGGIPEVITHNRTGLLIEPRTPAALACALAGLLSNGRDHLAALASAAREEWQSRFTLERYQRDVLALIESAQKRAKEESREDRQYRDTSDHYRVTKVR